MLRDADKLFGLAVWAGGSGVCSARVVGEASRLASPVSAALRPRLALWWSVLLVARVWALLHLPCALARPLLLACSLLLLLLLLLSWLGWLALAL